MIAFTRVKPPPPDAMLTNNADSLFHFGSFFNIEPGGGGVFLLAFPSYTAKNEPMHCLAGGTLFCTGGFFPIPLEARGGPTSAFICKCSKFGVLHCTLCADAKTANHRHVFDLDGVTAYSSTINTNYRKRQRTC